MCIFKSLRGNFSLISWHTLHHCISIVSLLTTHGGFTSPGAYARGRTPAKKRALVRATWREARRRSNWDLSVQGCAQKTLTFAKRTHLNALLNQYIPVTCLYRWIAGKDATRHHCAFRRHACSASTDLCRLRNISEGFYTILLLPNMGNSDKD